MASRGCRTTPMSKRRASLLFFLKINKSLCPRSTDKQTVVWKFHPVGKQRRRRAFLSVLQCICTGNSVVVTGGSLQTPTLASPKRSQWKPTGLVMVDLPHRESSLIRRKQTSGPTQTAMCFLVLMKSVWRPSTVKNVISQCSVQNEELIILLLPVCLCLKVFLRGREIALQDDKYSTNASQTSLSGQSPYYYPHQNGIYNPE